MAAGLPRNPVLDGENLPIFWVEAMVTKPVWYRVEGLRKLLKTNDVTD
jgi:hypothetical protein